MRVKPQHRFILSSTRRPRQQIHHQPKGQDKQKNKKQNKTKTLQIAAEEYGIVDILSKDMLWPKKTIRAKVEETRSGSKSRFTN